MAHAGSAAGLPAEAIESLFDNLPGVAFCTKDASLRFTAASAAMVELCGARGREEVIGRSASDFFDEGAAKRYETADLRVLRTRRSIINQLDQCARLRGRAKWVLLSHWPILQRGEPIGVATVARSLDPTGYRRRIYERLAVALGYLHANFNASFEFADLAASAGVSLSQLQRDFVQVLGLTPRAYLIQLRFEMAVDMLAEQRAIVEVAHACGYADQSAFTRRFRTAMGMSPMQYRRSRFAVRDCGPRTCI